MREKTGVPFDISEVQRVQPRSYETAPTKENSVIVKAARLGTITAAPHRKAVTPTQFLIPTIDWPIFLSRTSSLLTIGFGSVIAR